MATLVTTSTFVFCSHGDAGKILGTDSQPIPLHNILSRFTPQRCPTLENKPKIFFVQACQGHRFTDGRCYL